MSAENVKLGRGEVVVVVIGNTGRVQEYQNHPGVIFIEGKNRDSNISTHVPANTKAFIVTEGIEHLNYAWVMSYCRTRNVPYILRKSNQAIYDVLKTMITNGDVDKPTPEEVKESVSRGKLAPLIPLIDFTKSNAENAKALYYKAKAMNIVSTEASLAQLVANQRRKMSGTAVPRSARPKLDVSVELLDDMIKGLTDMRDFLIATVEENRLLRAKQEQFRKLMD